MNPVNFATYEIVRQLAKTKYDLNLGHSYIPYKSLSQGHSDILAILRNFKSFITNYRYNIVTQTFMEEALDGNRIHAISISQIRSSIQAHGIGIINTSVSIIFKNVLQYVNMISQMMLEETLQG